MTNLITRLWESAGFHSRHSTTADSDQFVLTIVVNGEELNIADITVNNGEWSFEYTQEFRDQDLIMPLPGFEDVSKKYVSPLPWPFLLSRVPSLRRSDVRQVLARSGKFTPNANPDDISFPELLRAFGEAAATNSYLLRHRPTSKG